MAPPRSVGDPLKALRDTLAAREPALVRTLARGLGSAGGFLSQAELRRALAAGDLDMQQVERLRDQYNRWIRERLAPAWVAASEDAFERTAEGLALKTGHPVPFAEQARRMEAWIARRGAALARDMTDDTRAVVKAVVARYGVGLGASTDTLAQLLRASIGLTTREERAVAALRQSLAAKGVDARGRTPDGQTPEQREARVQRYADTLKRRRAERIARTELASAYNQGQLATMQAATAPGGGEAGQALMKQVLTAEDERTCPVCGGLDGVRVPLGEPFVFIVGRRTVQADAPPFHPECRCTLTYEEPTAAEQARYFAGPPTATPTRGSIWQGISQAMNDSSPK